MRFMNRSLSASKSVATGIAALALALGGWSWLIHGFSGATGVAAAQSSKSKTEGKHNAAEHAADAAGLKQTFAGTTVDVYFDPGELDTAKPGLSGLKFLDHVDVTGKELLRFDKGAGDTWLIDPDTVFAFRARKGK